MGYVDANVKKNYLKFCSEGFLHMLSDMDYVDWGLVYAGVDTELD